MVLVLVAALGGCSVEMDLDGDEQTPRASFEAGCLQECIASHPSVLGDGPWSCVSLCEDWFAASSSR